MRRRNVVQSIAAAVLVVVVGCTPPTDAGTPPSPTPPSCPFDHVVMLVGDSLGVGYARNLDLPSLSLFGAAQGGASFNQVSPLETIIDRTKRWLEECGQPDLLVVEGGINDLLNGITTTELIADVTEFDQYLAGLGVPTLWVTIPPLAEPGGYSSLNPARHEYNQWLMLPGNVSGAVVNVSPAMEHPSVPDTLNPTFWWYCCDLFKPDGIHPNENGYRAMAGAVAQAIEAELAG